MQKMAKKNLLSELSTQTGISQNECDAVLNALAKTVAHQCMNEETGVTIPGLGAFSPQHKKARTGRNPATGESLDIPAKTTIKFKAHAGLVRED